MLERKVKGTAVKDVVIGVRSDKIHQKEYEEILSGEAKNFLNQRIMNSVWYSYELYAEIYKALMKVVGKNNREIMIKWGRNFGEKIMGSIYKNLILGGDVKKLMQIYPRFHQMLYNFGALTVKWISDSEVLLTYNEEYDKNFEMLYYSNVGWTQGAIEMCLKRKVNYEFLKKSWEGDDYTQFKLFWTP
ncbi:MAG: hypothetical protein JW891_04635 [Candidatus Lokiarchaeota archaeon]|nr:hypothetical protein [Candidatus Lokiarchaeota archaeon]